jgi:nucleoside-triphosphatase THEP1
MNNRVKFAVGLLLLIIVITGHRLPMIIALISSVVVGLTFERRVFRKIGKPAFWIFTIFVTLLAGSLLGEDSFKWHGIPISKEGVIAGLFMNIRAFTIVFSTVLIATSLSKERMLRYTQKFGLEQVNQAYESAIDTLPLVKDAWWEAQLEESGSILKKIARLMIKLMDYAEGEKIRRVKIFGITGCQGSGKSTSIEIIAKKFKDERKRVGGFYQKKIINEDGKSIAFDLVHFNSNKSIRLAEGEGRRGFTFDEESFKAASEWLAVDAKSSDILLVDELGILESKGKGHANGLIQVIRNNPEIVIVATFRKDKLKTLASRFLLSADNTYDHDKKGYLSDEFIELIKAELENKAALDETSL